ERTPIPTPSVRKKGKERRKTTKKRKRRFWTKKSMMQSRRGGKKNSGKNYFCSTWRSPRSNAISEYFEISFARLEYAGGEKFNMAYMRHTITFDLKNSPL